MPDHPVKLLDLIRIMKSFDVGWNPQAGVGSHGMFHGRVDGHDASYTVPTGDNDVQECYIKGLRKKFRLRTADGITDYRFYKGKETRRKN